ncbi:ABC transporter ATP-binding protein [Actinophytocola oryzae]|uniref:Peptide/nickel transport system ATP-binding protein/oligopeptide transport system ATP-binding protein n=1 Tax=Actinophytocola oryzae TaxID=502181 RepID=A0A4R7W4T0_9PSEU|nr:ABC transporter ATP-binding protein [Actinophytocola oryzae]TDV57716.1 peptide/nickel transport system ATP-binding protein/oligopeptide transport system ATP-binding protein [Actinophytocola oryzae]
MTAGVEETVAAARVGDALSVKDLVVTYGNRRDPLRAVDGVTLAVPRGQALGVIGESGSGKSTLVMAIAGLLPTTSGTVDIAPRDGDLAPAARSVGRGGQVQVIFQDPMLALSPSLPIWRSVAEPLAPGNLRVPARFRATAVELLGQVGIGPELADRRPAQLSGGQRQRVTIARAVAAQAPLIMCDEPVAALDISLQAGVLRLLDEMRRTRDLTYVFVSHDMTSIARIADQVGVMYLGKLVELGPTRAVLREPRHPYTQALISAVPTVSLQARARNRTLLPGEIPDARRPPSGCRFRTRCRFAQDRCAVEEPTFGPGEAHQVACHFWPEIKDAATP